MLSLFDLSVPKNVHKCDGCDRIFDDFNELLMKVAGMFRMSKTRIEIISVLHQRCFFLDETMTASDILTASKVEIGEHSCTW